MNEGEKEGDVDIDIEISPNILKGVLDNSYKRKVDSAINYRRRCKVRILAHSRCCDTTEITPSEDPRDVEGDR